jgi:uncharacterized membrane protein YccC
VTKSFGFREVVFSVNCFIAAMLSLWIAFRLDLKNPWWAMVTVYLTSQPLSGVMRARAVYRVVGTLLGAVAMVVIVPNLVDAPELTTAAIILWVALCLYVSLLDRTPRAYALALSGYTAALVGFPSVLNPGGVFDTAIARMEEIMLGTVCAALAHSIIFPRSVLSVLLAKQSGVLADAQRWIADGLTRQLAPTVDPEQRRIAADVTELAILGLSLPYDTSAQRPSQTVIRALDERLVGLLPLLSTIEDRIASLQQSGALPENVRKLLADAAAWFAQQQGGGDRRGAHRLRRACVAAMPETGPQSSWSDLIQVSLLARLNELIESWQECLELAALTRDLSLPRDRSLRAILKQRAAKPLHRDHGIAALSAIAAGLAMLACSAFWIATAWPQGATAVGLVAVICSLFATFDDPIPAMSSFTIGVIASVPLAGIYQFAILPAIDGYTWLVICLAPAFIPIGILMAIPRYLLLGLPLAVGMSLNLALQSSYSADMAAFLNTSTAVVIGSLTGVAVTQLMRVIGAETGARRLLRAGWRDLADLAAKNFTPTRAEWASRMLDRVGLLMPRLSRAGRDPDLVTADALRDLRTGINIINLEAIASGLSARTRDATARLLGGIAGYFRGLVRGWRQPPAPALLEGVDRLIRDILVTGSPSARHKGVAAAVGLRRNLYPDAPPYAGEPPRLGDAA